jgi:hypothetical protein
VTAGDYSVNFEITHNQFEFFKNVYYQESNPVPQLLQFKHMIRFELDKRLTKLNSLMMYEDPNRNVDRDDLNIAITSFTFENGNLIRRLKNRGVFINNEDWC